MHSGWGVLVAVTGSGEIVDRRRIVVIANGIAGGKQPYHHAERIGLPKAEKYLADYANQASRLARKAIAETISELEAKEFNIQTAALVLASGRTLPPLPKILSAHPLIHTAEGDLFRETIRQACESLGIPIMGYRERDLKDGKELPAKIIQTMASAGRSLGPPWTADHKLATAAAYLALKTRD